MQRMDGNKIGGPVEPGKPSEHPTPPSPATEQDDFEEAADSTVDLDQFMPQLKPKPMWQKVLKWLIFLLILLALIGGGIYWWRKHHAASPAPHQTSQSSQSSNAQAAPQVSTKQYTSSSFNLSFNYPETWTVADTGNGKLTVTSPAQQLTAADGQQQTGQIVLTIQNESSADFSMFKQGSAVAVLDSSKIAYSSPTPTQRANTYISFLQYASTSTHGALDGVYVTGDFGYQKNQTIPESDITKVDPVITVTFNQCSNASCSGTVKPMSISSSAWNTSSFSGPIVTMLKSLAIQ